MKNNDKIGLLLFTDRTELFIPPVKGAASAMRLIREVLAFQPQGKGTDLASAMTFLAHVLKKRAVVFLISDFIGGGDYDQPFQMLARKHDFVALQLDDESEKVLPKAGVVEFEDAETGEVILLDTSSVKVRQAYESIFTRRQLQLTNRFHRLGIDHLRLTAGHEFIRELGAFLKRRIRARK